MVSKNYIIVCHDVLHVEGIINSLTFLLFPIIFLGQKFLLIFQLIVNN